MAAKCNSLKQISVFKSALKTHPTGSYGRRFIFQLWFTGWEVCYMCKKKISFFTYYIWEKTWLILQFLLEPQSRTMTEEMWAKTEMHWQNSENFQYSCFSVYFSRKNNSFATHTCESSCILSLSIPFFFFFSFPLWNYSVFKNLR